MASNVINMAFLQSMIHNINRLQERGVSTFVAMYMVQAKANRSAYRDLPTRHIANGGSPLSKSRKVPPPRFLLVALSANQDLLTIYLAKSKGLLRLLYLYI